MWRSLLWVAVATALPLLRAPGARPYQALWAEDGGLFYNEALHHHATALVTTTYAGYLQWAPRLLSIPAVHMPVDWVAGWYAAATAACVAILSLAVHASARRLLHSRWAAALVTVAFVTLPQAGYEVNAAANDLHWYLLAASVWVVLAPARTRLGTVGACALTAVGALSDPLAVLALPAAALGWWREGRPRRALAPVAVLLAGLVAQVIAHHLQGVTLRNSPAEVPAIVAIGAVRVVLSFFTGDRLLLDVYPQHGLRAALAAVLLLSAIGGILAWRAAPRARVLAATLAGTGALFLVVVLAVRGTGYFLDRKGFSLQGSRYVVVPLLLLGAAVVTLVDAFVARRTRHGGPRLLPESPLALSLLAWVAVVTASDWSLPNVRGGAPTWPQQLSAARAACALPPGARPHQPAPLIGEHAGRYDVPSLPGPDDVTVAVQPLPAPGQPPLFGVVLACRRLTR